MWDESVLEKPESLRAEGLCAVRSSKAARLKRHVRHVWDRGFAGSPWLMQVLDTNVRFVLRWPKRYKLLDH